MSSVVTLVGVCTGLLPAAALTAAGNTTELISIGLEILRVNIRLSVDTDRVARQLEDAPYSCWGYLFLTSLPESIQEILDDFHQSQVFAFCTYPIYMMDITDKYIGSFPTQPGVYQRYFAMVCNSLRAAFHLGTTFCILRCIKQISQDETSNQRIGSRRTFATA